MSLASIVRKGVATANSCTSSLQVSVSHYPWIGYNKAGEDIWAGTAVTLQALSEKKRMLVRGPLSEELKEVTVLTIIGPVAANGTAERREPIDPRDKLVLPDNSTGPILDVSGLDDPSTGRPYMYMVTLG
jgi:hypothetical protein